MNRKNYPRITQINKQLNLGFSLRLFQTLIPVPVSYQLRNLRTILFLTLNCELVQIVRNDFVGFAAVEDFAGVKMDRAMANTRH